MELTKQEITEAVNSLTETKHHLLGLELHQRGLLHAHIMRGFTTQKEFYAYVKKFKKIRACIETIQEAESAVADVLRKLNNEL